MPHAVLLSRHPELLLKPDATMRVAIEALTQSHIGIALVVDDHKKLLGIVVDTDIRKALLRGDTMELPVERIMTTDPVTVRAGQSSAEVAELFGETLKSYMPVVDANRRLIGLASLTDYLKVPEHHSNWVVLMAGGMGMRLRPLTNDRPKPMVMMGTKPLLEIILEQLIASGFDRFILSVNYLAEQVVAHFGDGSKWGVRIEYLQETKPLGTAGALGLIRQRLDRSFLVMNGDLLTQVNFRSMLDFHRTEKNLATIGVKQIEIQIPYGVVQTSGHLIEAIIEKPVHRVTVNGGIYVLEPDVLSFVPEGEPRDMPQLLESIRLQHAARVGCFPIQEYWQDIGEMKDYHKAVQDWESRS